jgi:GntR family transcriptional regulator, carbon starvation induced regulator
MVSQGEDAGSVQLTSRNQVGDPWSSAQSDPPTRAQWVDQRLRQAILSGTLAPDERLITAVLSERFSVSPSPLREALQRLAAEGLVEITPQRGARVAALSASDWLEIIELRAILEPVALRDSFAHASAADFAEMEQARRALAAVIVPDQATPLAVAAANRSLHDALLSRATSRQLVRMITVLSAQSMRYHVLALAGVGTSALVLAHGQALQQALRERDADRAEVILTAHLHSLRDAAPAVFGGGSDIRQPAPGPGRATTDV